MSCRRRSEGSALLHRRLDLAVALLLQVLEAQRALFLRRVRGGVASR